MSRRKSSPRSSCKAHRAALAQATSAGPLWNWMAAGSVGASLELVLDGPTNPVGDGAIVGGSPAADLAE